MGFEELQKRAEQGDMSAQRIIGWRYCGRKDYSSAAFWLKKSAEQGDLEALDRISYVFCICSDENIRNDIEKWLGNFADNGMAIAQYYMGCCFEEKGNYKEALDCFLQSANQGEECAQLHLADIFEKGKDGIQQDYNEALKWYIKASEKGSLKANQRIGRFYEFGMGVRKSFTEALKWYQKDVTDQPTEIDEQIDAQRLLADKFWEREKYKEALKWYKLVAESSPGSYIYETIGDFYKDGKGVKQSMPEAMKWYKKSAEIGGYSSQLSFGKRLIEQGEYKEALYWLEKSAGNKSKVDEQVPKLIKKCHDFLEAPDKLNNTIHALIGLENAKKELLSIANLSKLQELRKQYDLPIVSKRKHLVFVGNPGSGKSYIAPIFAEAYRCAGILSKGHIITANRSKLVADTIDQTASKAKAVVQSAIGGVLFIDEASKLLLTDKLDYWGQEAVNVLLSTMDTTDDLIVILADRPSQAESLVNLSPLLKVKFGKYIYFQDYTPNELFEIFKLQCTNAGLLLESGALEIAFDHFQNCYEHRDNNFANGYIVQDYFEEVLSNQANRLSTKLNVTPNDIITFTSQDVQSSATNAKK